MPGNCFLLLFTEKRNDEKEWGIFIYLRGSPILFEFMAVRCSLMGLSFIVVRSLVSLSFIMVRSLVDA